MIRKTPAIPSAGVILGSRGSSSPSFTLALAVGLVAVTGFVGLADSVVDERSAVDDGDVECAVGGSDDAAADVGELLSVEIASVGELGESVVKVGKLASVVSCRFCRCDPSRRPATTDSLQLRSVKTTIRASRILTCPDSRRDQAGALVMQEADTIPLH